MDRKKTSPAILRYHGNVFTELLPSNDRKIHRHTGTRFPNPIFARIRCRGNVFTETLPVNIMRDKPTNTQTDGRYLLSTPFMWAEMP
jgi:hypothetical protein